MGWKQDFKSTLTDLDTPSLFESLNTYLWLLEGVTIILCIVLCILASNFLNREEYGPALLTFLGSIIVGASPYMAPLILY